MNENYRTFRYTAIDHEESIKGYLKEKEAYSERLLRDIKREGQCYIDGVKTRINSPLRKEEILTVVLPEEAIDAEPENQDISIVYEDDDLLVVNKKEGQVTHPTRRHQRNHLSGAIAHYFKEKNIDTKIRFVNRLDRDTTGLVLVAKNKFAHQFIQDQMKGGHVRKKYVAIAQGVIEPEFQTIDLPIGRKSEEDIERVVMKEGKPSVTDCRVVERYRGFSLVELTLKTGRTHQIRVHLKAIGHPLAGDPLYNLDADSHPIDRQALHAESLALVLPRSKRWIALQADLPEDMKRLIAEVKI